MEKIINKNLQSMEFFIDAKNMHYSKLNAMVKEIIAGSQNSLHMSMLEETGIISKDEPLKKEIIIELKNIIGQRYIGDGIKGNIKIKIHGVPGNDMAAFMDGPEIEVFGNAQDGVANTMNSGKIIIHGSSGDITGYSMRGGEIYIRDSVGWRSGIHMKSYLDKFPVIVIGGRAGNFLGEYMAGGIIIVLGLHPLKDKRLQGALAGNNKKTTASKCASRAYYFEKFYSLSSNPVVGDFTGTGMHGGKIFIRGDVEDYKIGREVKKMALDRQDIELLRLYIKNFCNCFDMDYEKIILKNFKNFIKLAPYSHRPYGKLYAY